MRTEPIEIEFDHRNANLSFLPLNGRVIRGRYDAREMRYGDTSDLLASWPEPIPGQRIGFDLEAGTAYIAEPLHDASQQVNADLVRKRGWNLAPAREEIPHAHKATWLYWMKRAVQNGAKVLRGELPETIEGEPRKEFLSTRQKSQSEILAEAVAHQTAELKRGNDLLVDLVKSLSAKK